MQKRVNHAKIYKTIIDVLEGAPYKTVREASLYQQEQVEKDVRNGVTYESANATLSLIDKGGASVIAEGAVAISEDTLVCGDVTIAITDIPDIAIHGRHELVFTTNEKYYELHIPHGGNAFKFLPYFRECKKYAKEKAKLPETADC